MTRTCYLNGQWVPEAELKVSAFDLACMQGASCFEMTRSFRQQHFKLSEHIHRLRESMKLLGITDPLPGHGWHQVCAEVTERNPLREDEEHRLLLVASPGAASMYKDIEGVIVGSYGYVATFPLRYTVASLAKELEHGVTLVTSPIRQVPSMSIPTRAKHRSRLHFHLAAQQAAPDWALMLTYDDLVAEGPGYNVCAVYEERIVCTTDEALPGISQQTVAELMAEMDYTVEWGDLSVRDLWNAQEVWVTATPFCCLPVSRIDGRPIGAGDWTVYYAMMNRWNALAGMNIREQLQNWAQVTV